MHAALCICTSNRHGYFVRVGKSTLHVCMQDTKILLQYYWGKISTYMSYVEPSSYTEMFGRLYH